MKFILILIFGLILSNYCTAQFFNNDQNEIDNTQLESMSTSVENQPDDPDQGADSTPNPGEDPVPIDQFDFILILVAVLLTIYYVKKRKLNFLGNRN